MKSRRVTIKLEVDTDMAFGRLRSLEFWSATLPTAQVKQVEVNVIKPKKPRRK